MASHQLDISEIKCRLRSVRADLDISQREAAYRATISKSVLEKYESRENQRIPNTRQLFLLAEAYGVSVTISSGGTGWSPGAPG